MDRRTKSLRASICSKFSSSGLGPSGVWNYPLYWYPIAVPLSHFPLSVAAGLWKAINFALLIAATHLTARALADISSRHMRAYSRSGLHLFVLCKRWQSVLQWSDFYNRLFRSLCAYIWIVKEAGSLGFRRTDISRIEAANWHCCLCGHSCSSSLPVSNLVCRRRMCFCDGSHYDRRRLSRCVEGFLHNIAGYSDRETANNPFNGIGLRHILIYVYSTRSAAPS